MSGPVSSFDALHYDNRFVAELPADPVLDNYDPDWTPNTTDAQHRRYRFGNQLTIAHWNLVQLAQAIAPLLGEVEPLQDGLDHYVERYHHGWARHRAGCSMLSCSS